MVAHTQLCCAQVRRLDSQMRSRGLTAAQSSATAPGGQRLPQVQEGGPGLAASQVQAVADELKVEGSLVGGPAGKGPIAILCIAVHNHFLC